MIRIYVAISIVVILVVCLLGAVNQDDRVEWEYGVYQAFHIEQEPTLRSVKLTMNAASKEWRLFQWTVGQKIISADNMKEFMRLLGMDDPARAGEVDVMDYLGGKGWEMIDYNYLFDREGDKTDNLISTTTDKQYFFKRRK